MRRSYGLQTLLIGCLVAMAAFMPTLTPAQDDAKVTKAMEILKAKTAALGAPKLDGTDSVEGKVVPALYFGTTKINNDFAVVDQVVAEAGGTATLFVKAGEEFVASRRTCRSRMGAVGQSGRSSIRMARPSPRSDRIRPSGEVPILGTPYMTGYEPIRDSRGEIIGIYYVGYKK
jgi:hypothetical protein